MQKKGLIILYIICLIALVILFIFKPDMGDNVLFFEFITAVCFVAGGIFCVILFGIHIWLKRKEYRSNPNNVADNLEDTFHKSFQGMSFKGVATLLMGILLLGLGMIQIPDCIKDYSSGSVEIVLLNPSMEYRRHTNVRGYSNRYYVLKGTELSNGEIYKFRFHRTSEINEQIVDAINNDSYQINMIIYPNTKAVVSMEICCYDKTIRMPHGQIIAKEDSTTDEKEDNLKPEDYDLPEYEIGGDYRDFMQNMNSYTFSKGFWLKNEIVTLDNREYMQIKEQELREAYQIPDDCTYAIYYKEDVEMFIIYKKESFEIVDVFVRTIVESL
ncbi:MAG: hypothetical protein IJZ42_11340 [Lachnospiraceae bacterium]|nr:hypothetical protein [Lachnospiraceae bacterium]